MVFPCANCCKECPFDELTSCLESLDRTDEDELTILEVIAELFGVSDELQCLLVTCQIEEDVPHLCQRCLQIISNCFQLRTRFLSLCRPGSTLISILETRCGNLKVLNKQHDDDDDEMFTETADDDDFEEGGSTDGAEKCESETLLIGLDYTSTSLDNFNENESTKALFKKHNLKRCSVLIERLPLTTKIKTEPEGGDETEFSDHWNDDEFVMLKEEIESPDGDADDPCDFSGQDDSSIDLVQGTEKSAIDSVSTTAKPAEIKESNHLEFVCSDCSVAFRFQAELIVHSQMIHEMPLSVLIKCTKCSYVTRTRQNMLNHVFSHTQERRFPCPEENCDYFATRMDFFRKHLSAKHNKNVINQRRQRPVTKNAIPVIPSRKKPLEDNRKERNLSEQIPESIKLESRNSRLRVRFTCSKCPKVFPLESQKIEHEKGHGDQDETTFDDEGPDSEPSDVDKVQEQDCLTESSDSDDSISQAISDGDSDLEKPRKIKSRKRGETQKFEKIPVVGGPRFHCTKCKKKFHFEAELLCHARIDHEQKNSCSLCDYKIGPNSRSKRNLLKMHFFYHTQEKLFKCLNPQCPFVTADEGRIARHSETPHIRMGRRMTIIKCKFCTKYFGKKDLASHMKKNHSEAPVDLCDAVIQKSTYPRTLVRIRVELERIAQSFEEYVKDDSKRFKCLEPGCSFDCADITDIRIHSGTHGPEAWKKFPCSQCGVRFRSKYTLKPHLLLHRDGPLKCSMCSATFTRPSLRRHYKTVHKCDPPATRKESFKKLSVTPKYERIPVTDIYTCDQCPKEFQFRAYLFAHVQIDHVTGTSQFHCHICQFTPTSTSASQYQQTLQKHYMYKHTKEKMYKCLFPDCHRQSVTLTGLVRHYQMHKNNVLTCFTGSCKRLICEFCGKLCIGQKSLDSHRSKHNLKKKPVKCSQCRFTTSNRGCLYIHRKYIHSNLAEPSGHNRIDLPVASDPSDVVVQKRKLSRRSTHLKNASFTIKRMELERIARSFEEYIQGDSKRFKCLEPSCSFDCADIADIHIHSGTHGSDALKHFPCKECGLRYRTMRGMELHLLSHRKKSLKCSKCSSGFTWPSQLRRHYRQMHECEPPSARKKSVSKKKLSVTPKYERIPLTNTYRCDQCPKEFKLQAYLFAHIQVDHVIETKSMFHCHLCEYNTLNESTFKIHYLHRHTKEKQWRCLFPQCGHQTAMSGIMIRHYQMHKNNVLTSFNGNWKKLICEFCRKVYVGQKALDTHVKNKHNDKERPFKCSQCGFATAYKCSLMTHMKHKHPDLSEQNDDDDGREIPIFSCEKCPFKSKWKGALVTHRKKRRCNPNHISRRGRVPHLLQKTGIAK